MAKTKKTKKAYEMGRSAYFANNTVDESCAFVFGTPEFFAFIAGHAAASTEHEGAAGPNAALLLES